MGCHCGGLSGGRAVATRGIATIRLGQIQTLHKQFLWVGVSQISVDHLSIAAIAF
jgi:hypothetical protein